MVLFLLFLGILYLVLYVLDAVKTYYEQSKKPKEEPKPEPPKKRHPWLTMRYWNRGEGSGVVLCLREWRNEKLTGPRYTGFKSDTITIPDDCIPDWRASFSSKTGGVPGCVEWKEVIPLMDLAITLHWMRRHHLTMGPSFGEKELRQYVKEEIEKVRQSISKEEIDRYVRMWWRRWKEVWYDEIKEFDPEELQDMERRMRERGLD